MGTGDVFLLPVVAMPQQHAVERAGLKADLAPFNPTVEVRLPRVYLVFLLALIAAYLGAIFHMDSIACKHTAVCYNYSKLEWTFSKVKVEEARMAWTPQARAAMALSSGLHILSSFLFAQLFIFGALACNQLYASKGWGRMQRLASGVALAGRVFNVLYCAAHCTIASMVITDGPLPASAPVAVGILLILALSLLISCAIFLGVGMSVALSSFCCSGACRVRPGRDHGQGPKEGAAGADAA